MLRETNKQRSKGKMMSRKDYVAFAGRIKSIENPVERENAAKLAADVFAEDNGRFDYGRFFRACNVERS